jgi:antitoxin (DNA-binding transcriptional repressor) of toxin-antitoxin stability system
MKAVGIRELKNRLSEYVRMVRGGESVLVTDRGEVVAELRPPGEIKRQDPSDRVLEALARRGNMTIGAANQPDLYPPLPEVLPKGTAQKLLDDERGEL